MAKEWWESVEPEMFHCEECHGLVLAVYSLAGMTLCSRCYNAVQRALVKAMESSSVDSEKEERKENGE